MQVRPAEVSLPDEEVACEVTGYCVEDIMRDRFATSLLSPKLDRVLIMVGGLPAPRAPALPVHRLATPGEETQSRA